MGGPQRVGRRLPREALRGAFGSPRAGAASYWISFGHKPRPRCDGLAAPLSSKINIKRQELPPLKRRVTFFCQKQQKKANQRKMLSFESQARTSGACAGLYIRDIPVPMKNGAHPCAPPCGSSIAFASARRRTATATATATLLLGRSGASRDRVRSASIVGRDKHLSRPRRRCSCRVFTLLRLFALPPNEDPEGGAQDVRRFSIGQGCPIEKSRRQHRTRGLCPCKESPFLWLPLTEGNPDGLLGLAKESNPAAAADGSSALAYGFLRIRIGPNA